ncbi:MAG: amino acid adenylation domain-containing protein, partial [Gemmatimonadetes bacterium]|nr:amino acid adenylation domain-containing protein [Gemmatimonadota bacterium]
MSNQGETDALSGQEIAVVGMAGRFPGAWSVEEFWDKIRGGVDCITRFTEEELLAAGVSPEELRHPAYVPAQGVLEGVELFDAAFFGLSPREATMMNPQHRLFLETAWEALENAGYDSLTFQGRIGSFSGSEVNSYWLNIAAHPKLREQAGLDARLGNTTSNVATRVAFELNLEGPSMNVQTACSSSLVAIHLGVQSLLAGESDLVLAGGVNVITPQGTGYVWQEGSPLSATGHCRSYDADARGAVPGSGVGIVVLRRLEDALADGDTVHAVIRGSTVNNDGSAKIGYTAPRKDGQAKAILEAIAVAGVEPESITYIEGHGSATELGDPIEVEALTQAMRSESGRAQYCALGSVKSNVGHLDTAAGVAGLIKTVMALEHAELPPSLHFTKPNPKIDFATSPFFVNTELRPWTVDGHPRRAGVSSFGMGGTNAHVVLEEAPETEPSGPSRPWQLLVLSARTPAALEAATDRLAGYLREHPEVPLADVAHTLRVGRRRFGQRRVLVCRDRDEAIAALESRDPQRVLTLVEEWDGRGVVFLFPGLGDHYAGMARGLYEAEPVFRREVDRCAEILLPLIGSDIREVLFPGEPAPEQRADAAAAPAKAETDLRRMLARDGASDLAGHPLGRTELAQPAVFVTEYALARTWMSWGVQPKAMIGHSLGEYVAATVAGVFTLADALALVAERARLIEALPAGAMLAVPMGPAEAQALLRDGVALAASNAPGLCTLSGPPEAIAALEAELVGRGVACRRLNASHAFHSPMMDPVAERLADRVRATKLKAPKIPFASNVTGTWITAEEAADPEYWTRHLCRTVRFAEGMEELLRDRSRLLLEVGPGRTLGTFALQAGAAENAVLASLRHAYTRQSDLAFLLETLGRLWMAGARVDWKGFVKGERRHRVPLPTYPFQRQRYWIDMSEFAVEGGAEPASRASEPARRVSVPGWQRALPAPRPGAGKLAGSRWLLFVDEAGLGEGLARGLAGAGAEVLTVRPGSAFAAAGERTWTVRPGAAEDYRALMEAVRAAGAPPRDVVHLWSVTGEAEPEVGSFRAGFERGYASLLLLASALERDGAESARIHVVADRLHEVSGAEEIDPSRAFLLGPCDTIPVEFPGVACRVVDVRLPAGRDAARVAEHLLAEVASDSAEPATALRGWRRWVQAPQDVRADAGAQTPFRNGGTYLFAGALGDSALLLARRVSRTARARLVLTVPTSFPPFQEWEAYLVRQEGKDDPAAHVIREIRRIYTPGVEMLVIPVDIADPASAAEALEQARREFGEIHGVFYTQPQEGVGGTDPSGAEAPFRFLSDALGTLEGALEGWPLDFCLIQTWIPRGGPERTGSLAAAHLAAAVARRHGVEHPVPWTAVTWDRWHEVEAPWLVDAEERETSVAEWLQAVENVLAVAAEPDVRAVSRHAPAAPADAPEQTAVVDDQRYARPALANAYVPPGTPAETRIAEVWQDMLGIDQVGVHDDFFSLGGHSLYATQIISRVRDQFQVELSLQAIFEHPTVAGLAAQVEELKRTQGDVEIVRIRPVDHSRPLPLSFQQERMWVLDQLEPGNPFYNVAAAQRFMGPLDLDVAKRSLREIVRRHAILRTGYEMIDGEPMQIIHEDAYPELKVDDIRHLPQEEREAEAMRLEAEEAGTPMDLRKPPLVQTRLIRMGDEDHILVCSFHHIAVDGWSGVVFFHEWIRLYAAFLYGDPVPLPELPIQYADYAVWQREYLSGERLQQQVDHWKQHLADAPAVLELPTDRPRPPFRTYNGGLHKVDISADLKNRMEQVSAAHGVTLFVSMLAVYKALVFRYTGQEDLIVGTVEANRQQEETEALIGFFINTLALRSSLRGDPTFAELFRQVFDVALLTYANADLPLEKLLESLHLERDLSRNPLLQVMFGLERPALNVFSEEKRPTGLTRAEYANTGLVDTGTTKFDLTFLLKDYLTHIGGVIEYNSDLFDAGTIERMAANYYYMLDQVAANPGLRLSEVEVLSPAERRQVLSGWNQTAADFALEVPAHRLFAEQAARTPDAPAVAFGERRLSYAELDRRTLRLAHALRARGVRPETPVGVCLERSPEMIVALLGILRAGGAFVPLDPTHPEDRLAYILEDAAVPVLLTQQSLLGRFPAGGAEAIALDTGWDALAAEGDDAPLDETTFPEGLAYVIYTSGSTGRPKGVRVEHRNLVNTLLACARDFGLGEGDVLPSLASYAFDIWLFEALCPLISGGSVRIIPTERITDMDALVAEVRDATLLHAVPALMRQLVRTVHALHPEGIPGVRRAFVGGDAVAPDLWPEMRRAFPAAELWVLYGPTEGTILCSVHRVADPEAVTRQMLGRPLANTQLYVCDLPGRPVPVGVPGEVMIGGAGVTRGYAGRPDLTAEKFLPDPFSSEPGARLYATGDRARWLADGTLEFLGRTDQQVKIRGYRIEPGEIEAALVRHPAVGEVIVMVREDEPGDRRLAAYLTPEEGNRAPTAAELRGWLKGRIPEYMIPSAFIALDAFPLTPTGKVDRNALPAPERGADARGYVAPRNAVEEALAAVWADVFRVERVGVHDNFFELGGDSILSIQVVARALRAGVQLKPRYFFEHPTIAELAPLAGSAAAVVAEQAEVVGELPLTPVQQWFFAQDFPDVNRWNLSVLLEPRAALDRAALEGAVRQVVAHHDALRLRFERDADGAWRQRNAGMEGEPPLEWIDLTAVPEAEQDDAVRARLDAQEGSLDLSAGPLFRASYLHLGEGRGRLHLAAHHLVMDVASLRVVVEDLQTAYQQLADGEEVALPLKTTSFRDWAGRLVAHVRSGGVEAETEFWLDPALAGIPALPTDGDGPNTNDSARLVMASLSEEETRAVMQEVTAAFHVQVNDVLLAALARAVARWTGDGRLLVEMEGHGREEILEGVDLSRTVGWFTAMYPVLVDLRGARDEAAALRTVRERLRALPERGIGHGLLRWMGPDEIRARMATLPRPEIGF